MYLPGTYHYNTYINEWSCHAVRAVRRYIKNGFISDLFFYVVGRLNENELVLLSVLNCLFDSINNVLKRNMGERHFKLNFSFVPALSL